MSSGTAMTTGFDLHDRLIVTHGVFAALATLFTVPFAILSVRFLRPSSPRWFFFHLTLQSLTIIFVTIVFALGTSAVMLSGNGFQFSGPKADRHHRLGLAIFVIMLVQAGLGVGGHFTRGRTDAVVAEKEHVSPHLSAKRHPLRFAHVALGLVIAALLYTQFYLGLLEWNMSSDNGTKTPLAIKVLFWIIFGFEVAGYFAGQIYEHFTRRKTMRRVAVEERGSTSAEHDRLHQNAEPTTANQVA